MDKKLNILVVLQIIVILFLGFLVIGPRLKGLKSDAAYIVPVYEGYDSQGPCGGKPCPQDPCTMNGETTAYTGSDDRGTYYLCYNANTKKYTIRR